MPRHGEELMLQDKIDWEQLAIEMLTNSEQRQVCIWADGGITTIGTNEYYMGEGPVATLLSIPVGNLDYSAFTDDFVTWSEEEEAYVVTGKYHDDQGRVVGSLENVILECIRDGDMSVFYEDWWVQIQEQIEIEGA